MIPVAFIATKNRHASTVQTILTHGLTQGEERLTVSESEGHNRFRPGQRDQIVKQRQVKTGRTADEKFRLKMKQAGQILKHRSAGR